MSDSLAPERDSETLEAFKDSFAYGSRTDLLFKFLKDLSREEAAEFLQGLLTKLGESVDDGDVTRLLDHVYEWQVRAYRPRGEGAHGGAWTYEDAPFSALVTPLSRACVALFTSSGHFAAGDDPAPFGVSEMSQEESVARIQDFLRSKPQLSVIPADTPASRLRVRHPGYDIRGALADPDVAFPLDRMRELAREGVIGELAVEAYSFVGVADQTRLISECCPEWAARLKQRGADAAVLVPV